MHGSEGGAAGARKGIGTPTLRLFRRDQDRPQTYAPSLCATSPDWCPAQSVSSATAGMNRRSASTPTVSHELTECRRMTLSSGSFRQSRDHGDPSSRDLAGMADAPASRSLCRWTLSVRFFNAVTEAAKGSVLWALLTRTQALHGLLDGEVGLFSHSYSTFDRAAALQWAAAHVGPISIHSPHLHRGSHSQNGTSS